jgi:hypothetical protein
MDNIKFVNVAEICINVYKYVGVYTQRSGYWAEGNQVKSENRYRFHNRREIMTTGTVRRSSKVYCMDQSIMPYLGVLPSYR